MKFYRADNLPFTSNKWGTIKHISTEVHGNDEITDPFSPLIQLTKMMMIIIKIEK